MTLLEQIMVMEQQDTVGGAQALYDRRRVLAKLREVVEATTLIHDEFHGRWPKETSMGGKGMVASCAMCNALTPMPES